MKKHPFISRVSSDITNREANTLLSADAFGKMFTGRLTKDIDFNSAVESGVYRFDSTSVNGPENVSTGYLLIHTVNPDYNDEGIRVRQLVYPDDSASAYTRIGTATNSNYTVTWSKWQSLGGGGFYQNYLELTDDSLGVPAVYYRAFNSFVLTLPDPSNLQDGNHIALEQHNCLGIVIDSTDSEAVDGRYLFDPISNLLFQQKKVDGSDDYKWILIGETTDATYTEDESIRPSSEHIEYLQPDQLQDNLYGKRFVAYVTTDADNNKRWIVETEQDTSAIIKGLITYFNQNYNTLLQYIDDQDTPYRLFSAMTSAGTLARASTFYKNFSTSVLSLPDVSEQMEGRWIGLEQHSGIGYVVESSKIEPVASQIIYDPETGVSFQQIVGTDFSRWIIAADSDLPADVTTNASYRNNNFHVVKVDASSGPKLFEIYITKDADNNKIWAHIPSQPITFI